MGTYEITLDVDLKLVRVVAHGVFAKELGQEVITKARILAVETGSNILYDFRKAVTRVALVDWFELPRTLGVLRAAEARDTKAAVVVPDSTRKAYQFYEDAAANVGLAVRVFVDEEEALAWLK